MNYQFRILNLDIRIANNNITKITLNSNSNTNNKKNGNSATIQNNIQQLYTTS